MRLIRCAGSCIGHIRSYLCSQQRCGHRCDLRQSLQGVPDQIEAKCRGRARSGARSHHHSTLTASLTSYRFCLSSASCPAACTLSGANATRSGLSLKAILAPRRRRIIKCPDDIPLLQNAVAAAREGDVVLLTANIVLRAPIRAPPFRITIAAATRGRYGARARAGPHGIQFRLTEYHGDNFADLDHDSRHPECPEVLIAARYFPGGTNNGDGMFPIGQTAVAAIVATGRSRLDLRGIAWHGTGADQQIFACAAVDATDGARVAIDNCWFSQFGDATLSVSGGAELRVRNVTMHRSRNGISAEGDGTSVVVDGTLFNGPLFCGVLAGRRAGRHLLVLHR